MKFAKELEQGMVPEWRAKYINYKQAKKRLKVVDRLYRASQPSPRPFTHRRLTSFATPKLNRLNATPKSTTIFPVIRDDTSFSRSPESLANGGAKRSMSTVSSLRGELPSFKLPEAAIADGATIITMGSDNNVEAIEDPLSDGTQSDSWVAASEPSAAPANVTGGTPRNVLGKFNLIKQVGSSHAPGSEAALDEYHVSKDAFMEHLAGELEKVNGFYKEKELEAMERLPVLRKQLHMMRDRRMADLKLIRSQKQRVTPPSPTRTSDFPQSAGDQGPLQRDSEGSLHQRFRTAMGALVPSRIGENSKALESMVTPHVLAAITDPGLDYSRRAVKSDVPYRIAKRKLKVALQEYHRSLELLKAYTVLNRTAFRKINKKLDKLTNSRPTLQFFNEKVSKATFVQSRKLDELTEDVEDLYARYFERGSHKIAVSKLRSRAVAPDRNSGVLLWNGILIGTGLLMLIQGLINASNGMGHRDTGPINAVNIKYLLQLYGGYLLISMLGLSFCLACWFWTNSKINYVFIFELNPRTRLDWQELLTIPSICFFLVGLFGWINFSGWGTEAMFLWYPVVLIGVTGVMLTMPFPIWYARTRKWLFYTFWRLFWSGLYPVEFRDFFLGDMFCSLVYSMGNISLFFCVYDSHWDNPGHCGSSRSRLIGFFSTLPAIWRALQCLRRYRDTRHAFPHMANFAKYMFTVITYMTLSFYRIGQTPQQKAVYILFSSINTIFSTIWDLLMDWSLLDFGSSHFLLRDTLGYKQKWIYYVAIVLDPLLRSTWIFYVIFPVELQQSALLSFMIAFGEILRRAIWVVFRLENEHCSNVGRFRASRDVPLPYSVRLSSDDAEKSSTVPATLKTDGGDGSSSDATTLNAINLPEPGATDLNGIGRPARKALTEMSPIIRTLSHVANHFHGVHRQDFERRRDPADGSDRVEDDDDSDDDDSRMSGTVTPMGYETDRSQTDLDIEAGTSTPKKSKRRQMFFGSRPSSKGSSGGGTLTPQPSHRRRLPRHSRLRQLSIQPMSPALEANEADVEGSESVVEDARTHE